MGWLRNDVECYSTSSCYRLQNRQQLRLAARLVPERLVASVLHRSTTNNATEWILDVLLTRRC